MPPRPGTLGLYDELLALVEREHALVIEGRIEELTVLHHQRDELLERLPATAPPEAEDVLRRMAALQAETTARLTASRDRIAEDLLKVDRGRTAVEGYGSAGRDSGPRHVDGRG